MAKRKGNSETKPEKSKVRYRRRLSNAIDEATILATLRESGSDLNPEEKAALGKEYASYLRAHEFYFTLSLQAVAFFYAIVGGILSIYFAGEGKDKDPVLVILLGVPLVMSVILGGAFVVGGYLWRNVAKHVECVARMLRIIRVPDVELLTYLLWLFGFLFLVVGGGLTWLITRVT